MGGTGGKQERKEPQTKNKIKPVYKAKKKMGTKAASESYAGRKQAAPARRLSPWARMN